MRHRPPGIATVIALGLMACLQQTGAAAQARHDIPHQSCTVARFISDTGDADFIQHNLRKTYDIVASEDGFIVAMTSDHFTSTVVEYLLDNVTDGVINTVDSDTSLRGSVDKTLAVDLEAVNSLRRVVQTVIVGADNPDYTPSRNQWTLECRDATPSG